MTTTTKFRFNFYIVLHGRARWGVKALPRFFCIITKIGVDAIQEIAHIHIVMTNKYTIINKKGSYKSTIVFIASNGYGEPEYRVKVTYNNGENVSLLKSYKSFKSADKAAKRELNRLTK